MEDLTDADIHALIIARDEQAFAEWERRTARDAIRAVLKHRVTPEDAEDIWNEALVIVWQRAVQDPPIEPPGEGLRRYTFGVVSRLTANLIRARSRHGVSFSLDERDQEVSAGLYLPSRQPSTRVYALRRCMEMIDERWRIVLEMSSMGAGSESIAAALKIAPGSLRKYLQRARAAIAACIQGELDE